MHTDGYEPEGPIGRALHLRMVPFTGTAKHLVEKHGLEPHEVDRDDALGLAHDHAVLHGFTVNADGTYTRPPGKTP